MMTSLGTKRTCQSCGSKYYDFNKGKIICPSCGAVFDPEVLLKSRRIKPVAVAKQEAETADVVIENDDQIDDNLNSDDNIDDAVDDNDDDIISISKSDNDEEDNLDGDPTITEDFLDSEVEDEEEK